MAFTLDAACMCSTGRVRGNNEDNFFFDNRFLEAENKGLQAPLTMTESLQGTLCFAVFDGMGGENFGEQASFSAAAAMKASLSAGFKAGKKTINELCLRLNEAVVGKARELYTERMGSTLVGFCFTDHTVFTSNLGDSRAYRLRGGEFTQLSVDHVDQYIAQRKKKAPLTQHLGIPSDLFLIEPAIRMDTLEADDQYLLCSDGLTDMLSDTEIAAAMQHAGSAKQCVQMLTDAALERGGRDNITVIVCRIQKGGHTASGLHHTRRKYTAVLLGGIAALVLLCALGYLTIHNWSPASCTKPEICRICGKARGEALGHTWGEWMIVAEPSCTEDGLAQRICANDPSHVETQPVPALGHRYTEATCTEPSVCTVCGEESVGPIGHDWDTVTYSWADNNSSVTAKRSCARCGVIEEETVSATGMIITAASCAQPGLMQYTTDAFQNDAFYIQEKGISIPPLLHEWSAPVYMWSADSLRVAARRSCSRCGEIEEETVNTTSTVLEPASCEQNGLLQYMTDAFQSEGFQAQVSIVDIPALEHAWASPVYTWSDDNGTVTAERTCLRCLEVQSETVRTVFSFINGSERESDRIIRSWTIRFITEPFRNDAFSLQAKYIAYAPEPGILYGDNSHVFPRPDHHRQN